MAAGSRCSFCNRTDREVRIVAGRSERICVECVVLCDSLIEEIAARSADRNPRLAGLNCSFCSKGGLDVKALIAGPRVFICSGCVERLMREEHLERVRGPTEIAWTAPFPDEPRRVARDPAAIRAGPPTPWRVEERLPTRAEAEAWVAGIGVQPGARFDRLVEHLLRSG